MLDTLTGDVVRPGDDAYDEARQAFNLTADQRPAAVVAPAHADDIAAILAYARENNLRVAPQGPGHGAPTLPSLDEALLLRTAKLNDVAIDADAQTARVGAGAVWNDVVPRAAEHGLAALHGSAGTVGVSGYSLGGGIGWLARKHGLQCNQVVCFDVVTADGEARTVDANSDADLFWALRGGGGSHAIVTALTFRLLPLREVYAGQLMWQIDRAADALAAFREWTPSLPDEVTSSLRVMRLPDFPVLPEPLRGQALVMIGLAFLGDAAAGDELVAPLRDLGPRHLDSVGTMPAAELAHLALDPPAPAPGMVAGVALSAFPAEAADALVALAGPGSDTVLLSYELRHFGGALQRSSPDHGAVDTVEAAYAMSAVGTVTGPDSAAAIGAAHGELREAMAPWSLPGTILNFAEGEPGISTAFEAATAHRLASLKQQYDPANVILANHDVNR